jgi:hypothetical protein
MVLASANQSRLMPRTVRPPTPELMTVAQAAAYFSVNQTWLQNLLNLVQLPVISTDSWGNPLYSREAIRQQIRP